MKQIEIVKYNKINATLIINTKIKMFLFNNNTIIQIKQYSNRTSKKIPNKIKNKKLA